MKRWWRGRQQVQKVAANDGQTRIQSKATRLQSISSPHTTRFRIIGGGRGVGELSCVHHQLPDCSSSDAQSTNAERRREKENSESLDPQRHQSRWCRACHSRESPPCQLDQRGHMSDQCMKSPPGWKLGVPFLNPLLPFLPFHMRAGWAIGSKHIDKHPGRKKLPPAAITHSLLLPPLPTSLVFLTSAFLTLLSFHPHLPSLDPREPGYVTGRRIRVRTRHSRRYPQSHRPSHDDFAFYPLSVLDWHFISLVDCPIHRDRPHN
ncbi:hypothetical protein LZ31DRAFT_80220 [Colletotrichum somersetense]|nr:hypothetical protein LZ31DRAFT_80220 [Colletotrichum somersetense]